LDLRFLRYGFYKLAFKSVNKEKEKQKMKTKPPIGPARLSRTTRDCSYPFLLTVRPAR
jgi:hypothetical protein